MQSDFAVNLLSGAAAGFTVDVVLFPLDTIKTRLQSAEGFRAAGGFRNIYKGLGSAAVGSAPSAALFFTTYEYCKGLRKPAPGDPSWMEAAVHMGAAVVGESAACLVRVPTDNVKQKLQAGHYGTTGQTLRGILSQQGLRGFYTGYGTTMLREAPFALIQFPVYERLKAAVAAYFGQEKATGWQAALCGSAAGALAAACTTPLDVIRTRMILAGKNAQSPLATFKTVVAEPEGWRKLLSGLGPRVTWIGIGGSVFFGMFETTKGLLSPQQQQ